MNKNLRLREERSVGYLVGEGGGEGGTQRMCQMLERLTVLCVLLIVIWSTLGDEKTHLFGSNI